MTVRTTFFGAEGRRLYGAYHEPEVNRRTAPAVLLCYPGVHEYNTSHWSFRRLAAGLARAGCATLRFDYGGTGDSEGGPRDVTIESMVEDIARAYEELQDLSGARRIWLVGLRLGAAAACLASLDGVPARGLVLWECVTSGREYLSELETRDSYRNLLFLHGSAPEKPRPELLGYGLSDSSRLSLSRLDLVDRLTRGRVLDAEGGSQPSDVDTVVFVPRSDQNPRALEEYWTGSGAHTTTYRPTDEVDPSRDISGSEVRLDADAITAIVAQIGGWSATKVEARQRESSPSNGTQKRVHEPATPAREVRPVFTERTFQFEDEGRLAGIVTEPVQGRTGGRDTAILMWNVGLNHHVGPYRVYSDLARECAGAGFPALRFDLSGLGDSEQAKDGTGTDAERAVTDIRSAMGALERELGIRRFVLVGFCSSVDSAHAASLADERVVGLVNIEGYSFPTLGHRLRKPLRFVDLKRWQRWVFNRRQKATSPRVESPEAAVFQREYPTPERLAQEYRKLIHRGLRFLFLYVRGDSVYEHRDQLFEFLGDPSFAQHMDVEFYPHADHIFSRALDREVAVRRVVDFLCTRFRGPARD